MSCVQVATRQVDMPRWCRRSQQKYEMRLRTAQSDGASDQSTILLVLPSSSPKMLLTVKMCVFFSCQFETLPYRRCLAHPVHRHLRQNSLSLFRDHADQDSLEFSLVSQTLRTGNHTGRHIRPDETAQIKFGGYCTKCGPDKGMAHAPEGSQR